MSATRIVFCLSSFFSPTRSGFGDPDFFACPPMLDASVSALPHS